MSGPNNTPIFSRRGQITVNQGTGMPPVFTTATNSYDGTGTNVALIFLADATNGSLVERIRVKALGTNTASVMRFFLNNGSTNGTATNNTLIGEVALPATTASATAATAEVEYPLGFVLQAGFRIYATIATTVVAGWQATVIAGDY